MEKITTYHYFVIDQSLKIATSVMVENCFRHILSAWYGKLIFYDLKFQRKVTISPSDFNFLLNLKIKLN